MASKKTQKKVEKYIKKLPMATKVIAVIIFLVSLVGSFGVTTILQKNDKFVIGYCNDIGTISWL